MVAKTISLYHKTIKTNNKHGTLLGIGHVKERQKNSSGHHYKFVLFVRISVYRIHFYFAILISVLFFIPRTVESACLSHFVLCAIKLCLILSG